MPKKKETESLRGGEKKRRGETGGKKSAVLSVGQKKGKETIHVKELSFEKYNSQKRHVYLQGKKENLPA